MVLKHGHLGEYITSTWTVLKCGAREGWSSFGPIVWEIYIQPRRREISYKQ